MRLKRSKLKLYHHRKAIPKKDHEGTSYTEYDAPSSFLAEVWSAGGEVQAELYGNRLQYIYNCLIEGAYTVKGENGRPVYVLESGTELKENDGICLFVSGDSKPDYRIISIRPYSHLYMEVEKL